MTVLTRWDPFRELQTLQNRMSRLFEDQYGGREEALMTSGAFVPPVDIYEDQQGIQLKLEVPGIEEKDLDIKVENNVLTVSGDFGHAWQVDQVQIWQLVAEDLHTDWRARYFLCYTHPRNYSHFYTRKSTRDICTYIR